MAERRRDASPVMHQSTRISQLVSDDAKTLNSSTTRLSAGSSLSSTQRYSHVLRISEHGANISLTVTEPLDLAHPNSYALHLGPRLSVPPPTAQSRGSSSDQRLPRSRSRLPYQRSTLSNELLAIQYDEPQECAIDHVGRLWSPWPLRFITLLAVVAFLSSSISALEILSLLSRRPDGIRKWTETARFIWTYPPPLLFIILASVWSQVEYRTKQLMPWRTMATAPASASHSILLNYITPLNIISFTQSLSSGHPGVAVSIAVGFLNKLTIIISTAVLSLQDGKLIIQPIPLRIMETLIGSSLLLVASMTFLRPAPATPNDTSTIAGLSAILSNSTAYVRVMRGLSLASPERLEEEVYQHRYQTSIGKKGSDTFFRLSLASKEDAASGSFLNKVPRAIAPEKWWSPIHDLTRLSILAFILGALVAVELLHQRSQTNTGLVNMADSNRTRYLWQVLPGFISVVVMMFVGMVDHATRLIQPFQMLKRGHVPAARSIEVNYLAHMAPVAVFKAIQNRHWGVVFSAAAALIAPILTVASSALFFPINGRLVQDSISTRIIEGLLGAIFFLMAVSSVIADTRRVLPYNPYSIARMSSLIAESSLLEGIVPPGTEWASPKTIKDTNVFSMFDFSLGYFEKPRPQRKSERIFGIDVGDALAPP
ncbi:uncharacterized protein PV09_06246 [Verruconis gallopava]|uniref:Uncharacterized protein n=1 Tax=Verruconis gallopava TaxID=253628 RepID=A0A0D2A7A1_9PEZI|nr:uncharacterized protein PV09_06246 [Verruconis gallopava]KIW02430.1 hypothetical protein PV09_06246 [Verruconis gallopava]